jgi:molybdopterin-synthase adenylyltransferase
MTRRRSAALAGPTHDALCNLLLRPDGQEDLCLAIYRPSTGLERTTALIREPLPPHDGERIVHGNVTVTAEYILRGAETARARKCGLVLLHSHPGGEGWQAMSGPDRDTEASYANLVREITGHPLVGMTLAGRGRGWSARHWDQGVGGAIAATDCAAVRVVADRLALTWNDRIEPPPPMNRRQARTVSAWGESVQADLARRRVLVVGLGSVGLDVALRLAASGLVHVTLMDFDLVEAHNLDRLVGATRRDVTLRRPKAHVARREALRNATATDPNIRVSQFSICEPAGLAVALDHDLIFSCVDRPWPRAVLNSLAFTDLIPVIDGGIAIDTHVNGGMRNATWRSHVVRPGRPCMSCTRQLDMGQVAVDMQGLLDDPGYIARVPGCHPVGQNIAPLSISVTAGLLAQYVSFSVAPGGLGDPGPLQYVLSNHQLEHLDPTPRSNCIYEPVEPEGDQRAELTGRHPAAEAARTRAAGVPRAIRLARALDDRLNMLAVGRS